MAEFFYEMQLYLRLNMHADNTSIMMWRTHNTILYKIRLIGSVWEVR